MLSYEEIEITDKKGNIKTYIFSSKGFWIKLMFSVIATTILCSELLKKMEGKLEGITKILAVPFIFCLFWIIGKMIGYSVKNSNTIIGVIIRFIMIFILIEFPMILIPNLFDFLHFPKILSDLIGMLVIAAFVLIPIHDIKIAVLYYKSKSTKK